MRVDAPHDLAVELQHQPQDPVRRRVLRAEVDVEVADLLLGHQPSFPAKAAATSAPVILCAFPAKV